MVNKGTLRLKSETKSSQGGKKENLIKSFFIDEEEHDSFSGAGSHGYFTKAVFLQYVGCLSYSELANLDRVFELTSKSVKLNHLSNVNTFQSATGKLDVSSSFQMLLLR